MRQSDRNNEVPFLAVVEEQFLSASASIGGLKPISPVLPFIERLP